MHSSTETPDLSTAKVTDLIRKFALPAIMSSLVGSIYNIADQIFVGQKLGTAGNAATNVAFPLVLLMVTFPMMIGSGGASKFSLHQGAGEHSFGSGRYCIQGQYYFQFCHYGNLPKLPADLRL